MDNKYKKKIIFFLHLHKCGGTTIDSLFNKHTKHKPNTNGNPWLNNEQIIKFWNYDKKNFNNFLFYLYKKDINFVAFEWNYFKYYNKINLSNIELLVCFREPFSRYVSNMKHKKVSDMREFNKKTLVWTRNKSPQIFKINHNKFNYYVKMLNGFGDMPNKKINRTHLEIAKKNLQKFSTIIILEIKDSFKLLKKYNIHNITHKNKSKNNFNLNINYNYFKKKNKLDYELYYYAIKLSYERMKKENLI